MLDLVTTLHTPLSPPGKCGILCSSARANTSHAACNNYNIHLMTSVPTLASCLQLLAQQTHCSVDDWDLVYVQHVRPGPGGHPTPGLCWEMLVVKSDQSVGGRHLLTNKLGSSKYAHWRATGLLRACTYYNLQLRWQNICRAHLLKSAGHWSRAGY